LILSKNGHYYLSVLKNIFRKVEPTLLRAIAKESYTEGAMSSGGRSGKANTVALTAIWLLFFGAMFYFVSDATKRLSKSAKESGLFGETEEEEYLVESSDKNFSDVRGMDEILEEFEQAVDLLTNSEKYAKIGAKVPSGILLNGPPGTGKTLIAKAIAGEAGVPFLYASGSQVRTSFNL
jgi:ATP-dependent Zn protease